MRTRALKKGELTRVLRSLCVVNLVLCAAVPAFAQGLRAGFAKVDVTPSMPVMMGGYSLRDGPSSGVHDDERLYVRAIVFEASGVRVAFVKADVISVRDHDSLRQRMAEATGIPVANILLGDTHNHAAPAPRPEREAEWDRHFTDALVDVVAQASASLQPVNVAFATGRSRIAMNRRQVRKADSESTLTFDENHASQSFGKHRTDKPVLIREFAGVVRLGANPAGPIDDEVQIVRVDTTSGRPLAVMIHYACHGTSLGGRNDRISGEWMGRMQEYVEENLSGAGAIFLQGAAGDINPRIVGGLDGNPDTIATTWALGEEIGREVVRVCRQLTPAPTARPSIQIETADILLPRTYRELFADFKDTAVKVPTTMIRIGDLMWVTFPGEMFSAIGKRVKAALPATQAHVMGYTNGRIGYFPEQNAYSEGGYEVAVTHLDPAAEPIYLRAVAELTMRFR